MDEYNDEMNIDSHTDRQLPYDKGHRAKGGNVPHYELSTIYNDCQSMSLLFESSLPIRTKTKTPFASFAPSRFTN